MDLLKLVALDNDDIEVLSAHVQDSVVKVGDVLWRPSEKRLIIVLNRFVKCRNVSCSDKDAVLNLLAVEFSPTDSPAGHVTLTFSGGIAVRLDVECLEVELADLGPVWATAACPAHVEASAVKMA